MNIDDETYALALQNALSEIRGVSSEVQTSFIFDGKANLIAGDSETPGAGVEKAVTSLQGIMEKVDSIGGLNSLVVESSKGFVHISLISDIYLAFVTSKKADIKYLQTLARVLIPTITKLLDSIQPTPLKTQLRPRTPFRPHTPEPETKEEEEEEDTTNDDEEEETAKDSEQETSSPEFEVPSNQLIVESFGGLLVRGDTVHVSDSIMSEWKDLLEGKRIDLVEIEAFNGQTKQCKIKTVNDSKLENQAVIRIPEKICQTLDIKKGELVRVKPVIT